MLHPLGEVIDKQAVEAFEIVRSQMRTNFGMSELTVGGQCKDMQKILG